MTRGRRPALHGRGALSGGEVPLPGAGKYHWPASHLVRGIVLATESAANHATVAHVRVERYCASSREPSAFSLDSHTSPDPAK